MKRRFYIKIEVDLHAITCPGVCLCPSGYVEITLKTLGYFFKAGPLEPKFPILCHDQFLIEGYFKNIECFTELERVLATENFDVSLWQNGRRLAYFRGTLQQVLYQSNVKPNCYHNVNVQLLMKPSRSFPGIISPKLELSSRAMLQTHGNFHNRKKGTDFVQTFIPNFSGSIVLSHHDCLNRNESNFCRGGKHQKPVCHMKRNYKSENDFFNKCARGNPFEDLSEVHYLCDTCFQMEKKEHKNFTNGTPSIASADETGNSSSCSSSTGLVSSSSPASFNSIKLSENFGIFSRRSPSNCSDNNFPRKNSYHLCLEPHSKNCKICESYAETFK